MHNPGNNNIRIIRFDGDSFTPAEDRVATEEPLEISIRQPHAGNSVPQNISVTMRTPGHDAELALGFLFTEGILKKPDDYLSVESTGINSICVSLDAGVTFEPGKLERHFYTSSSCGVCGKSSIESLFSVLPERISSHTVLNREILSGLNDKVREAQMNFQRTGGLHASALFTPEGELKALYEDVGRHNALDKLIGSYLVKNIMPETDSILFLSGRACYELVQKAAMAGIPVICALGAPSSLAVELANEMDITLLGFLKKDSFNIYSGSERIR